MNFNNSTILFIGLRNEILAQDKALQATLTVVDGHVIYKRNVIARFTSNADAIAMLNECGFRQISEPDMTAAIRFEA